MSASVTERYQLLQQLSRYEDAYKRALRFASVNTANEVADLSGPFYELVKHYKNKINAIRTQLRST